MPVRVRFCEDGGYAHRLDICPNDVLVKVGDEVIRDAVHLSAMMSSHMGEQTTLSILRYGDKFLLKEIECQRLGVQLEPATTVDLEALERMERDRIAQQRESAVLDRVQDSTLDHVPGYRVVQTLGVVHAVAAYGAGLTLGQIWNDQVFDELSKSMSEASKRAIARLKIEASHLGADAVLGIQLQHKMVSVEGRLNYNLITGTGTAAKLLPE